MRVSTERTCVLNRLQLRYGAVMPISSSLLCRFTFVLLSIHYSLQPGDDRDPGGEAEKATSAGWRRGSDPLLHARERGCDGRVTTRWLKR